MTNTNFIEFYKKIYSGNKDRYIAFKGFDKTSNPPKKTAIMVYGEIPFEKHLEGNQLTINNEKVFFGLSPIEYTKEDRAVCRWIGFDRDEDVDPKIACGGVWAIDNQIFAFKSTSGRWHYYKFFDQPIDVLEAQQRKDHLLKIFLGLNWKMDKDKCLPTSYSIDKKTPGGHLFLPRFYDGTKCFSPRGEVLTPEQFQFRYNHRKHPLISGSVGLTSGNGGRQKHLFNIALYLKHTAYKPLNFLDDINNNFNTPEAPSEVEHARDQSHKYDLKYLVNNYSKYTKDLTGVALSISELLAEVIEKPENEKILKQYEPPEDSGQEITFQKKIVFCKKEDIYWDCQTWDQYNEHSINQTFQHLFKQKPSLIYSKNPDKVIVESTAFRPDLYKPNNPIIIEDKKLFLNDYKPKGVEALGPDKCDEYNMNIKLFLELVGHLNNGTEEYIEWLLDFLATTVQEPGKKIRQIPFYASRSKRVGKGTLFHTMQKIHHKDYAQMIDTKAALDKGKTFLHRKLLVLVDEIYLKGDTAKLNLLMNQFKLLASENEHSVRTLYKDYRQLHTTTNVLFFSNYPDALSYDEKEGRYFYVEVLGGRLEDSWYHFYWDQLDIELKTGKQLAECVKHYLLNRKIKTYNNLTTEEKAEHKKPFSADGTALLTEFFYEACKKSGSESKRLCRDLINEKDTPFNTDVIAIGEVHKYLVTEYNLKENINYLAEALEDLGGKRLGDCKHKPSDKHPALWIIRNLDRYIKIGNGELADNFWLPLNLERYNLGKSDEVRIKDNLKQLEPKKSNNDGYK
ncbi:MAG: DUF5906 domain-containing protein [bacterium]|nr:DUF5906 domain-containing protein [bacterium]